MKFSVNKVKQGLGELQTTLHWAVSMINSPTAVGDFGENLQMRVQTAALPEPQADMNKVELQGHVINFPGKTTKNGQISMTIVEGTDAAATAYFTKWAQARWQGDGSDTTGKQALTADLKGDLKLELMGPDDTVTQTYKLIGCIASMNANGNLGQSADPLVPSITIEYDDFHIDAGGIQW